MPVDNISKKNFTTLKNNKKIIYNYGMKLGTIDKISINNNTCIIPTPLTIAYAISLGFAGNSKEIYLAGFDGREKSDPYNDNTQQIINLLIKQNKIKKILTLTKTNYILY